MRKRQSPPILRGKYTPPVLRRGDRANCLVRGCMLVVSSWSDAPISWPRGCPPRQSPGSASLIVDEELARAVQHESAAAISYWWGVSTRTVVKWRRSLGANRKNNEGSHALVCAATTKARSAQSPNRTDEYRQKQRENIIRRRSQGTAPEQRMTNLWTPEHRSLLGTMPDRELAARIGRTYRAVSTMRKRLQVPAFQELRREAMM
jgi:hypothetical protein